MTNVQTKILSVILFAIGSFSVTQHVQAQESGDLPTAKQVIGKWIEALGGEQYINSVQTLVVEGTRVEIHNDGKITVQIKRYYKGLNQYLESSEQDRGSTPLSFSHGYRDTTAWFRPSQAKRTYPYSVLGTHQILEMSGHPGLALLLAGFEDVQMDGKVKIDGQNLYALTFVYPTGKSQRFFDVESGMLVLMKTRIASNDHDFRFVYRDDEGTAKLDMIELRNDDGPVYTVEFKKIEANTELEDSLFDVPPLGPSTIGDLDQ